MNQRAAPGVVRDSIVAYLANAESASLGEICRAVAMHLGEIPASSVRSYLNINTPGLFERTGRGHYKLRESKNGGHAVEPKRSFAIGKARLYHDNCFDWMKACAPRSIHAIVTDPPYGLLEYTETQQEKLRKRRGGVWRIPPSFDGRRRSPLPRFTVLNDGDRAAMRDVFFEFAQLALRVTVPAQTF